MYIMMYIDGVKSVYSVAEARSLLPSIIDQAEAGLEVELTRRGQPVAVVVSRRTLDRLRGTRRHFGDAYRDFLRTHTLDAIGIDRGFAASLRDRTRGREVGL